MKIGNINFNYDIPLFLAPMAGVTDLTFRGLCREMGADFTCTEMISAKALSFNNKNTFELMKTGEDEHPVAVQLFGTKPELMADMASRIEDSFDVIDINMGCPVAKVVNNGEGSALMKNPQLAFDIVDTMVRRLHKPVTVKIRLGFDQNSINAVSFAQMLEDAGASAIAVHGRTRAMMYSGRADYAEIAKVKKAVGIPVIGNGDVFSGEDAIRMIDETGVDGIMIARGAQGNPWIFREVRAALSFESSAKPDKDEVKSMILRHARGIIEEKGKYTGICEMRKHIAWYTKGMTGAARIRERANYITSFEDIEKLVDNM